MSLFTRKPTAIVYVRRQDIIFVSKKSSARLDIPTDLVQNLEVNDSAKLSELVSNFLDQQKCHRRRVLIALDQTVLCQKYIPRKTSKDIQTQAAAFEQLLPFDTANRQSIAIVEKEKIGLFGTNKLLLQSIILGVQMANKIRAVLPASLYGISDSKSVNLQVIATLFSNTKPLSKQGFPIKL